MNPVFGVDHVQVVVRDLEMARRTWARLGFTPTPRGRHLNRGSGNYCLMLREGYIELIGVVDPALPTSNLDAHLAHGPGPIGLAFGAPSAAEAARHLQSAGLAPTGPTRLERVLERDGADVRLAFDLVNLPDGAVPGFRGFVCCHLSPDEVREPAWLAHPNGAIAASGFVVAAADPKPVLDALGRIFGPQAIRGQVVETGRERIEVVAPGDLEAVFPGVRARPGRPLPCLVGMSVRVGDLKRCKAALESTGVDPRPGPGGSLLVAADEATGAVVAFHS
ncbi:MAG: VOC family protein [Alphaproteobacteria bacterium]|nr:VOC family protein [Alphaproteobacteria bacterium]